MKTLGFTFSNLALVALTPPHYSVNENPIGFLIKIRIPMSSSYCTPDLPLSIAHHRHSTHKPLSHIL